MSGINLEFHFGGEVGWFCVPVVVIDLREKKDRSDPFEMLLL
jgi:hypothetical protein